MTLKKVEPRGAWLNVNRKCQLRCQWCYATGSDYDSDMSYELAITLTEILIEMGINKVLLIGGEPSLWPYLFKYNKFCNEHNVKTVLVTNGIAFSNDIFWKNYLKTPCSSAGISIKAGNPSQLHEVAGVKKEMFASVKKGIERYTSNFNKFGIGITFNSFYLNNLPEIVEFAMDCGAKSVKIDFCHPPIVEGKPESEYMIEPLELTRTIEMYYEKLNEITNGQIVFQMNVPFCFWSKGFIELLKKRNQIYSVCQLQKRNGLMLDTDGSVIICNGLFDYPVGKYNVDFTNHKQLDELLNNRKNTKIYNKMIAYPSTKCQECLMWEECAGGCPLRWSVYDPEKYVKPITK
ncbi:radical SAM protein [bacterium]|nr:radical SAM protein [bacterium]